MRHRGVDADGRIAAAILNRSYDQIFDIIVQRSRSRRARFVSDVVVSAMK